MIFLHLSNPKASSTMPRKSFAILCYQCFIVRAFSDCALFQINKTTMGDNSDLDQQIEQLRKCEVIKESDVKILCAKAREILGRILPLKNLCNLVFT